MQKSLISPFLTFNGQAEEAINYYVSCFPGAKIAQLLRYGDKVPHATKGNENRILMGILSFKEQEIMFLDMDSDHSAPMFNWANSIHIYCNDEAEFDVIFDGLSKDGMVMMGPEPVAHFRKCAWVTDKFGVTWQTTWE
ncbi:MAG: VOC family protein [Holophagaceae bacterium]|nr:VOC family protein [Holophagaceae bacterium]